MRNTKRRFAMVGLLAFVLLSGGCASDAHREQGVNWVVENEARLDALEKAGFPQRIGGR
jgi:hypothetical protein